MLGSGAVVVMAEGTDLLAAATNVLRFFRNESCGKCVPCRVGSTKAHAILARARRVGRRRRTTSDERIVELEETMRLTSICGLGQVALGPGDQRARAGARRHRGARAPQGPRRHRDEAVGAWPARRPTGSSSLSGRSPRPSPASGRRAAPPPRSVPLDEALGRVPDRGCCARRTRCPASRARPSTASPCAPRTPTAPRRDCPSYLDVAGAVAMGEPPEVAVRPGTAVAIADGRARCRRAPTRW